VAFNGETVGGKTFATVFFALMANSGFAGFEVQFASGGLGLYQQSSTSAPALVVVDGQATGLTGGGTFNLSKAFSVPGSATPFIVPNGFFSTVNNNGAIYFASSIAGGTAYYGEFLGTPSNIQNLMNTADTLPAGAQVTLVGGFGASAIAAGHFVGFSAQESGGPETLFVTDRSSNTTTKIASEGAVAPGGSVLGPFVSNSGSSSGQIFLNSVGQVTFGIQLLGGGAGQGIYIGSPSGPLVKVAATGDPAAAGGIFTSVQASSNISPSMLNDSGQAVFWGSTLSSTSGGDGVFLFTPGAGGSIAKIAVSGDPAPGGGTFQSFNLNSISIFGSAAVNASGQVAFGASTSIGVGIFVGSSGGSPQKLVTSGDSLAGGTVSSQVNLNLSSFNDGGAVAFTSAINFSGPPIVTKIGVFEGKAGNAIQTVVLSGTPAPDTGGGTFSIAASSADVQVNSEGDVVFSANVTGGTATSGYFRALKSAPLQAIALQGQPVPGGLGTFTDIPASFVSGGNFVLGPQGTMAFVNTFVTGGGATPRGDFGVTFDGTPFDVISPGDSVPGTGGGVISFVPPIISPDGAGGFAVEAFVSGGTANEAILWTSTPSPALPTVYIDSPAQGTTVSGTVNVSGWAVDNASVVGTGVSGVQVKVDGTVVGTATYGSSRPDVCAVYPGRPGCPNVGFSFSLNTSTLSAGSHNITVTAADSDGTSDWGSSSIIVTVQAASPTVYIDAPAQGSAVSGTVTVSGWVLDNASVVGTAINNAQVKVDGSVVGTATYGISRPDVCAVYPGRPGCPNVGFSYSLNTSTLSAGSHTITVTATDSDGTPDTGSSSVSVYVQAPPPTVYIDAPASGSAVSGTVTVSGWAVDNASVVGTAISGVQVKVDGTIVGTATYGSSRPDVCAVYPGRAGCPNVGFSYALNTSALSAGSHTIMVTATDSDGSPDSGSSSVTVTVQAPLPTVYIDAPAQGSAVSGTVTVSGWAVDNASVVGTAISSVQVKVDGSVVGTATYGISRSDVCAVYPGRPGCPNVGYSFSLNTSTLSAGSHTITVTATDSDGTPDSGSSSVTVNVQAPLPTVYIDAPAQGSAVSGTVTVSGWAVDNASVVGTAISSVQVKVDGSVVGTATYGSSRPDVCAVYPGRVGCPNVGFSYSLDTSSLSPGSHTITVTATDGDGVPDSGSASVSVTTQPTITSLSKVSGAVGDTVTISGVNFGATQSTSTVKFNGVSAGAAGLWSTTSITINVPAGASTGNLVVSVGGVASNGLSFNVVTGVASVQAAVPGPLFAAGVLVNIGITVRNDSPGDVVSFTAMLGSNPCDATCGTFGSITGTSGSGSYTLPYTPASSLAAVTTITLNVSSNLAGAFAATANFSVNPAGVRLVTITGLGPILGPGLPTNMTARVFNDAGNQGATIQLLAGGYACPITGGGATACGTISTPVQNNQGTTSVITFTYTPPSSFPDSPFDRPMVLAAAKADNTKVATAPFRIGCDKCVGSEDPQGVVIINNNFRVNTALTGGAPITIQANFNNDTGSSKTANWTLTSGGSDCQPSCGMLGTPTYTRNGLAVTASIPYTPPSSVPTLALLPVILATSVDNGSSDGFKFHIVDGTCGTGNNGVLNGRYAFLLRGGSALLGYQVLIGSFTADGSGNITGGLLDGNRTTGPTIGLSITSAGSSYSIGPDNRGCLTLANSNGGVATYRIAVGTLDGSSHATQGQMVRFDDNTGNGQRVQGHLMKQDPTAFTNSSFSGNYVAGFEGIDSAGGRVAVAEVYHADGAGNIGNIDRDADDNGTLDSNDTTGSATYSIDPTTGRGTATFMAGAITTHSVAYMVNSSEILSMSTDVLGLTAPILSGENRKQTTTSYTQTSLDGKAYVFSEEAVDPTSGGNVTLVGQVQFATNGSATGQQDINDNGTVSNQPISDFLTIAANGRATNSDGSLVFYLIGTDSAAIVGTGSGVVSGYVQQQTGGPFSNASLSGPFFFRGGAPTAGASFGSGIATFDGLSAVAVSIDDQSKDGMDTAAFNFSYSVTSSPAGKLTITSTDNFELLGFVVSGSKIVFMSAGTNPSDPELLIGQK